MGKEITSKLVEMIFNQLEKYYAFPENLERIKSYISNQLNRGEYENFRDEGELCEKITNDLYVLTSDKHLRVVFEQNDEHAEETEEEFEVMYEREIEKDNFGFQRVERLKGNVGYINISNFHMPKFAGQVATTAMNFIAHTDALIIDIRNNGGGFPDMVSFIMSYLLSPEPIHINDFYLREDNYTKQFWTLPYVPGKRYGSDKPVYVLTSSRTFSAAEQFAYCLKVLSRATIIGEATCGGANPASLYTLVDRFKIYVPDGKAIHPVTQTNWEGTGVEPHIQLAPIHSFDYAYREALKYVVEKYTEIPKYKFLVEEAEDILNTID